MTKIIFAWLFHVLFIAGVVMLVNRIDVLKKFVSGENPFSPGGK